MTSSGVAPTSATPLSILDLRTSLGGLRVDGYDLALYFPVIEGRIIATTLTFFGANPAEVTHGPQKGV